MLKGTRIGKEYKTLSLELEQGAVCFFEIQK